jgi:hypothetical protein
VTIRKIVVIAVSTVVAGCSQGPEPAPRLGALPPLKAELAEPAAPLPSGPACDREPTATAQRACRAAYEARLRTMYVTVATRKDAVVDIYEAARAAGAEAGH